MRSLEQFIPTVKGQNIFGNNAFLTCSWRCLRANKLERLEFKLEKILGFRNMHEKLENDFLILPRQSIMGQSLYEVAFWGFLTPCNRRFYETIDG